MSRAEHELREAKRLGLEGRGEGLAVLRRALLSTVFAAVGKRGAVLTGEEAHQLLTQSGVAAEQVTEVCSLLGRIDAELYGGGDDAAVLLGEVEQLIRALSREAKT